MIFLKALRFIFPLSLFFFGCTIEFNLGAESDDIDSSTRSDAPDSDVPDSDTPDSDVPDSDVPDSDVPDSDAPDSDVPDSDTPQAPTSSDIDSNNDTAQGTDTAWDTNSDLDEGWINKSGPYAAGAAASAILSDGLHYLGGSLNFFAQTIYRDHYVYDSVSQAWKNSPANVPDGDAWGAQAHVYQDRLYLVGGYPSGSRLRVYDPDTNSWTTEKNPLPKDFQWGFASGIMGQNLYIFGGEPHVNQNAPGYKYDFAAQGWSSVAPIPYNNGRGGLSSAVVGDRIFVLNGNTADGTTILQIYDSASNSWSLGPSLNGHSFEAAATAVQASRVYFFGGAQNHDIADSSGTALLSDSVNIYDTVSGTWATGLPMNVPKMWAAAQFYNGQFYVLGGFNAQSAQLNDLAIYTP